MAVMKKSDVDKAVRNVGEELIDTSNLTHISGSTFFGNTVVDGHERFFEIKVTAKKLGFCADDVEALLAERSEIEKRKAEVKAAAAKKAEHDKARRSKATAEAKTE